MSDTPSRLLQLLSLLQARRDWPGGELAERLEVSPRTIRRDVGRLRALGYPVESVTGPGGRYRLEAGTAMPPLLLDEDEAIAIAVGLRTAARASVTGIEETSVRALVKLEQVLPAHLRRRVAALGSAIVTPATGPTVDPQHLTTIAAACRNSECLRFAYRSRDGTDTRREVEPISLVNYWRRWYLVAWDRGRADWRTFRVDRLARPAATGVPFTARRLPAKDAGAYVQQNISGGNRYEARVIVHAPADALAQRIPHIAGSLEPIDADRCVYRTNDDDVEWLALRIAMLGVDVDVDGPPELIAQLDGLAQRLRRAADGGATADGAVPIGGRTSVETAPEPRT